MSRLQRTFESALSSRSRFILNGRNFFILFWLVGTVALLLLKLYAPTPLYPALAGALLVGLYGILAVNCQSLEISQERAGDGAYYLGFLYTLASLVVALYQFSARSEDSSFIVASFGIALTSSITGVAVRVIIAQGRDIVGVTRDRMENELLDATKHFGNTLKEAVGALNAAQVGVTASFNESTARVQEATEARLVRTGEGFAEQVLKACQQIEQAAQGFSANAERINGSANGVVSASTQLCERLENIRPPEDVLEKKLEGVFRRIEASALAMERGTVRQNEVLGKVDIILSSVAQTSEHITEMAKRAAEQTQAQHDLVLTLAQVRARFDDLEGYLKRVEDSGGEFIKQRRQQLENLRNLMEEERTLVVRQHNDVQKAHQGIGESVQFLQGTLKEVSQHITLLRNISNRLPKTAEKFEAGMGRLGKTVEESRVGESLDGISDASARVLESMDAVAGAVPELARVGQTINEYLERQNQVNGGLERLGQALEDATQGHLIRTCNLANTYENELAAMRTTRASLEEEARHSGDAVERNQKTLRALVTGLEEVSHALPQLSRIGEVTENHLRNQEQVNQALTRLGETLNLAADQHLTRAHILSETYEGESGRIRQARETLEGEASLSVDAVRQTQAALRGLVIGLKEELSASA